jgi:transposase
MGWWPFSRNKLKAAWNAMLGLISSLLERIRRLEEQVKELQQRNQELTSRLAQNSRNSHRPPGSDGLAKPPPKSLRRKSRRRPGGQPGHVGRTLLPVASPDHIETHRVGACPCGAVAAMLAKEPVLDYTARQVFELPPIHLETTEHRAEIKRCPCCGRLVQAVFPADVRAPVQYGSRMRSLLLYFHQQHFVPPQRVGQICEDLFGQPCSPATVLATAQCASQNLEGFEQAVVAALRLALVVHRDETGLRAVNKLHWMHVASTSLLTLYWVHPKRGIEGIGALEVVPTGSEQWLVHDCWAPYFAFDCQHALCNEHLLRELKFLEEECGEKWAARLSRFLLASHRRVKAKGTLGKRAFQRLQARYRAIVRAGRRKHPRPRAGQGRTRQSKAANLLGRLEALADEVLAFTVFEEVPFTNNQGEQDMRMVKVQQKISGCFRTLQGARVFARIRSYISTCRKQGRNIWEALQRAVEGQPFMPAVPALGP